MIRTHDDVIKWGHFPRYWTFVRGIHRSPVNSPHKGQWRGALMFSLICARINRWANNRKAGDLRRCRSHFDVIVMRNVQYKWQFGVLLFEALENQRMHNDLVFMIAFSDYKETHWDLNKMVDILQTRILNIFGGNENLNTCFNFGSSTGLVVYLPACTIL